MQAFLHLNISLFSHLHMFFKDKIHSYLNMRLLFIKYNCICLGFFKDNFQKQTIYSSINEWIFFSKLSQYNTWKTSNVNEKEVKQKSLAPI